jgi:cyclic pyranopterin phosphate synthase
MLRFERNREERNCLESKTRVEGPLYLRLSVTDRCNYYCRYCRVQGAEHLPPERKLSNEELLTLLHCIHDVAPLGKIRLTGGEPMLHPGLIELVGDLRLRHPGAEICLTTNGSRLAKLAPALHKAGLTAINISLDTLDETRFARLTGGGSLPTVLEGLHAASAAPFGRKKINTVLLRTFNGDQLCDLVRLAATLDWEIRFIELMPIGPGASLYNREFLSASEARQRLEKSFAHLGALSFSGTARRHLFRVGDREIAVGFITPVSQPFCSTCNRIRLDSYGRLHSCLRDAIGVPLADLLRQAQPARLEDRLHCVIGQKCRAGVDWPARSMAAIGG